MVYGQPAHNRTVTVRR